MTTQPSTKIETFKNPRVDRDYTIYIDIPEFTCLCPLSGQPDFAKMNIAYIPDDLCIELKSLKLYMWTFRDRQAFHEAITNEILDHLCDHIKPRFMSLDAMFNTRGGIQTSINVEYTKEGWNGSDSNMLP